MLHALCSPFSLMVHMTPRVTLPKVPVKTCFFSSSHQPLLLTLLSISSRIYLTGAIFRGGGDLALNTQFGIRVDRITVTYLPASANSVKTLRLQPVAPWVTAGLS